MSEKNVCFKNDRGRNLAGIIHYPADFAADSPAVIVCHGMLSEKSSPKHRTLCEHLAAIGFLALRFDFSFRGESDAPFEEITFTGEVRDLEAAVTFVRGRTGGRISLVGSSMGGAVSILYTGGYGGIAALVSIAPVADPGKFVDSYFSADARSEWKRKGQIEIDGLRMNYDFYLDAKRQDLPAALRSIDVPTLVIHGTADEVLPPAGSQAVHALLGGEKGLEFIEGADHRFSRQDHLRKIIDLSTSWVDRFGR